jgi:hypothetical protein
MTSRKLLLALVVCLVLPFMAGQKSAARQMVPNDSLPPVELTVGFDYIEGGHAETQRFRVSLRNNSKDDLCLNIGFLLANGKRQFPQAIVLSVSDAAGKTFQLFPLQPGVIAGRVDPYILPLPAGGLFSFPVDLKDYLVDLSSTNNHLKPGTYSLEARFTSQGAKDERVSRDARLMPLWAGTVKSNSLQFVIGR